MTYNFEAHQAASLLQGTYLSQGMEGFTVSVEGKLVKIIKPDGFTALIDPRLALLVARNLWHGT